MLRIILYFCEKSNYEFKEFLYVDLKNDECSVFHYGLRYLQIEVDTTMFLLISYKRT